MKNNKEFYKGLTIFYNGNARLKQYYKLFRDCDNNGELFAVYGRYSSAKQHVLYRCRETQKALNGYRGQIITHCTSFFTYGFLFEYCGRCYFAVITPTTATAAPVSALWGDNND